MSPGDHRRGAVHRPAHARREPRARDSATQAAWRRRRGQEAAPDGHPSGTTTPPDTPVGPLVRPYTMTGGRTRPSETGLDIISIVVATRERVDWGSLEPEHAAILRLCDRPVSVAELSAQLDIPITVVKVLVGDLIAKGDMLARAPLATTDLPKLNLLQAVLDGIRRL